MHMQRQCGASTACEEVRARRAMRCCDKKNAIPARQKNPHAFVRRLVLAGPFNAIFDFRLCLSGLHESFGIYRFMTFDILTSEGGKLTLTFLFLHNEKY